MEIKTKKVGNNKESQQQEIKLKDQLNKIKVENDQLMNKIGEKDIKIQNLKECMDKFEEIKNKGNLQNYEEEVKKLNLDEILTEDDLDDKNNIKDDMNIEEKKIRNEIKKALNENQSKKNEIDKTKQFYTNIIQKKDGIINALESQINIPIDYQNNLQSSNFKPNPNMNINNNIDINNNNEELFIDNNNFNPNEFANEEEQYEQVGEEGEGQNINANNEIHDLDGIGENEGEEGYIDENQNKKQLINILYNNKGTIGIFKEKIITQLLYYADNKELCNNVLSLSVDRYVYLTVLDNNIKYIKEKNQNKNLR